MKKLLKIVLWSAVALVALAVLLIATLPLWLGPVARPIANCLGPRITQTDFYLGGLSLNPYTGRLAVRDLRIGNPAGYAEPTALNLGSLVVVLDGASLAGDCLHVREVTLKDCFVSYLYGGENGIDNLTQLKMNVSGGEDKPTADAPETETADPVAAEPEAKDFKVIVDRLSVSGVRVKFQMLTIPVPPITLTDLGKFPCMKKTDLRDEYPYGLTAAPMRDINRFHCSSGTTGKPICIPQTKEDVKIWTNGVARCMAMYGITQDDIVQVSYGYGLFTGGLGAHYGAEELGCAVLPTGAGNTEKQIMLMQDLGVTVICCTPSYFLHLATVAEQMGVDFRRDTKLKHGVFGAEPWTDEIRAKIEQISGITAHDIYGLTEIAGPGVAGNCEHCHGLHVWEDHFYPEIIDPDTLEVLPDGEEGELVFTTLDRVGTPMVRYRTRDLSRLQLGQCKCGRTMRVMDRVHARSDDMLIIHGVNVFPSQIEACLMKVPEIAPHYMIELSSTDTMDLFELKVEVTAETFSDSVSAMEAIKKRVAASIKEIVGLSPKIYLVAPGTLPRSQGKIKRVIDNRKK